MPTPSPLAIEARGLVKCDGIDLAVSSGSVYGVLAPNGAAKTKTIRMPAVFAPLTTRLYRTR
jgi:ABC-type multidrug transport system ATPase subunit